MEDEYYMTEEQRVLRALQEEEKDKKFLKRRKKLLIVVGILAVLLIGFFIYEWIYDLNNPKQRKPVLYLYPEETTEVMVQLDFKGRLTTTYPKYENGWQVTAKPDGTLTDAAGKTYRYLYWEGVSDVDYDLTEGFCVKGSDTAEFLENALAQLGLTRAEANEFIVYWLPYMENNAYNIISFQNETYTENAKLFIKPQPDTVIRVFMTWRAGRKAVDIPEQKLTAPERTGFTVVEWGGCEVR